MAKRTETTGEDDSLLLIIDLEPWVHTPHGSRLIKLAKPKETRNLLRIAIYNIKYIRGIFSEKYFNDKSVPGIGMKLKKLMPMDAKSRRLIDWMKKGVYDARQKKYLKTLLFCICEKEEGPVIKEYAFSFANPMSSDKSAMNLSRTGSQKNSATFKSNLAEVTTNETRFSGSKVIRTLDSLMRTSNQIPEEVKSVLDPCDDNNVKSKDYNTSLDNEPDQDNDFSDTEVRPSEAECYIVAPNDTQYPAYEKHLTAQVREWTWSSHNKNTQVSCQSALAVIKKDTSFYKTSWCLDSGSSYHITGNRDMLNGLRKTQPVTAVTATGDAVDLEDIGYVNTTEIKIGNVYWKKNFEMNIISVGLLDESGKEIDVGGSVFTVREIDTGVQIGQGHLDKDSMQYVIDELMVGAERKLTPEEESGDDNNFMSAIEEQEDWVVDSGNPHHLTKNMQNLEKTLAHDNCANPLSTPTAGSLNVDLQGQIRSNRLTLNDVYHCSSSLYSLVSVAQLDLKGYRFNFQQGVCRIFHGNTQVGTAFQDTGSKLYYVDELHEV